jgi:glutamyl-Q tRNA(Asp) synthetase
MPHPVLRFAPSPNGELHLGHAYSALVTHDLAHRMGGRFLLRIEDIDRARCHPHYEAAIFRDLAWLGLDWEHPVRRQSDHMDAYRDTLARLDGMGLLYQCFATRAEIHAAVAQREARQGPWPRDPDGAPLYPGLHKGLTPDERAGFEAQGRPFALRLDMEKALARAGALSWAELSEDGTPAMVVAEPARWGDVVIARKDVPTSYHLSVVVDDVAQAISHVTRGRDLYPATSIHRLLQVLLGLPEPLYYHHRLIRDGDGAKLSKSRGDTGLRALREAGADPNDIRRMVALPAPAGQGRLLA